MQNSGHCDKAGAGGYNETTVVQTMDALVKQGLDKLGYKYLNLDDCWIAENRTKEGKITADPSRFPSGMAWLAAQAHSRGLKLGLYEAASLETCRQYPGSQGHEELDAATLAGFGADFVKLDSCGGDLGAKMKNESWPNQYLRWSKALNASGRQIVFSCSWAVYYDVCLMKHGNDVATCATAPYDQSTESYIADICHMWRYDDDLFPTWSDVSADGRGGGGVGDIIKKMGGVGWPTSGGDGGQNFTARYREATGPGAFNDPDFVVVGCPTDKPCEGFSPNDKIPLSDAEQRTQMSIWCMVQAPLIVGSDVRSLSPTALATLSNTDAIAINQDTSHRPVVLPSPSDTVGDGAFPALVWTRVLADGSVALSITNMNDDGGALAAAVAPEALGLDPTRGATAKDVWAGTSSALAAGAPVAASVGVHETALFIVSQD